MEVYCTTCNKYVELIDGGRCPHCGSIPECQQTEPRVRELNQILRSDMQVNRSDAHFRSNIGAMRVWEAFGAIVGLVFIIVGFGNVIHSSDDYNVIYDPLTKAIYGLYIAIGLALAIYYAHESCKK